jgi:hypothetical protein
MIKDAQGQSVTGATAASVVTYDLAVRAFNSGFGDAIALFDAVCDTSPVCVMAYLGKAWMFALANDPGLLGKAKALLATAEALPMN